MLVRSLLSQYLWEMNPPSDTKWYLVQYMFCKKFSYILGAVLLLLGLAQTVLAQPVPQCDGRSVCPALFYYNRAEISDLSILNRFKLIVINEVSQLDQIVPLLNPDITLIFYYSLHQRANYDAAIYSWEEIDQHESWFLHETPCNESDIKDCRIEDTRFPGVTYFMDLSNQEYINFMLARYQAIASQYGVGGFMLDGPPQYSQWSQYALQHLSCYADNSCPSVFLSEAAYENFYGPIYSEMQSALSQFGLFANSTFAWNQYASENSLAGIWGELCEDCFHLKSAGYSFYSETLWRSHLDKLGLASNASKVSTILTGGTYTNDTLMKQLTEFTAASFLLGKHSQSEALFAFAKDGVHNTQPIYYDRIYNFDIGAPLASYQRDTQGLYSRSYQSGLVLANPAGGNKSHNLGSQSYLNLDGTPVAGNVIVGPFSGKILLIPTPSPTPTQTPSASATPTSTNFPNSPEATPTVLATTTPTPSDSDAEIEPEVRISGKTQIRFGRRFNLKVEVFDQSSKIKRVRLKALSGARLRLKILKPGQHMKGSLLFNPARAGRFRLVLSVTTANLIIKREVPLKVVKSSR